PFPRSLQRAQRIIWWTAWGLGVAVLIVAALSNAALGVRVIAAAVGAGCAVMLWWLSRRQSAFATIIEGSPFRISEIAPDGSPRSLRFNRYPELPHEPKQSRFRLSPGRNEFGIVLDYRRMGFDRLVERVIEYGGFRFEPAAPGT